MFWTVVILGVLALFFFLMGVTTRNASVMAASLSMFASLAQVIMGIIAFYVCAFLMALTGTPWLFDFLFSS